MCPAAVSLRCGLRYWGLDALPWHRGYSGCVLPPSVFAVVSGIGVSMLYLGTGAILDVSCRRQSSLWSPVLGSRCSTLAQGLFWMCPAAVSLRCGLRYWGLDALPWHR